MKSIAMLGDRSGHPSHQELDALIPRLRHELDVDAEWLSTPTAATARDHDALWLVPGSPYIDDQAVYLAIQRARESGQPFLGTCGGLQYAVLESLRHLVETSASHAESDGLADDNAVVPLSCRLQGQARLVTPVPGTRFASWAPCAFEGMHFCSYAPSAASVQQLADVGVVVTATAPDVGAEVLEWTQHPFFVASLFQPHIGTKDGAPIHPLILAFVDALTTAKRSAAPSRGTR